MISFFDRVIEYLLEQKEVEKAVALLKSLDETMESMVLKDKQIFAIRRIIEKSSSPHHIGLLGKVMEGNGEPLSEPILQYLRFLTRQAVDPLCHLLGELEAGKGKKTLQILNKFGEKGRNLIQKFLTDSVSGIRAKSALLFARNAKVEAVKPLTEIILSEDFYKRAYEEKASFFRALNETGSKEVIPILKKIAKKRRWFQRAKWNEMRQCANHTLKTMGG